MLLYILAALICVPAYTTALTGKYIIKFKSDAPLDTFINRILTASTSFLGGSRLSKPGKIRYRYSPSIFNGIAGEFDKAFLEQFALQNAASIEYIEPDLEVKALALAPPQSPIPSWGLGRISQAAKGGTTYTYDSTAGEGATVYVIDTGINIAHADFEDRASLGFNAISDEANDDLNGHGTHCAGTVAGKLHGVAKKAKLVAVKVLNKSGSGSTSGVIAGINWVASNCVGRCIISMSLGGGKSDAMNTAVNNAYTKGITVVVAAGNDNANACNYSPASATNAITVGAIDEADKKAYYSNSGSCVDLYAPGSNITSTWLVQGTKKISGTSMATPHVAGIAALIRGKTPTLTNPQVSSKVISIAISISGLPKKLAQNKPI